MAYNPAEARQAGKWTSGGGGSPSPAAMAQAQQAAAARVALALRMKGLTPAQRQYLQIVAAARGIQAKHDKAVAASAKRTAAAKKRAVAKTAAARLKAQRQAAAATARRPGAIAKGQAAGRTARQGGTVSAPKATAGRAPASQGQVMANLAQYLRTPLCRLKLAQRLLRRSITLSRPLALTSISRISRKAAITITR